MAQAYKNSEFIQREKKRFFSDFFWKGHLPRISEKNKEMIVMK
jgi:hypothetical protein